ncbi:GGDEF domain-containing protein [Actinoplanes oblitus]|uniref:GGDEF domain-containing protein n=1 Tax=Actinoplanes oblitus TaxID=3040509 RepID=A0ABY8WP21_9ACTN|nr:GGDEF domain-containing protein [Actinoplanes oblitus]WIM99624.1 GGDEF domain-containing protein [Actinoplanes oblitus]
MAIGARTLRPDPVLLLLVVLTVAAVPGFGLSGAPARVLLPLYWAMLLLFQAAFAAIAVRLSRRGETNPAGRRFWRHGALAFAVLALGNVVQVVQVVTGPLDHAAYMGSSFLLGTIVLGAVLLSAGLLRHPNRVERTSHGRARLRLDTATVVAGAATFAMLVVQPPTGSGAARLLGFGLTILAQPILFLLLIFGVVRLAYGGPSPFSRRIGLLLGVAAVIQAVTQAVPETLYLPAGRPDFALYGASVIGCGLAAIGARLQDRAATTPGAASEARPEHPFSRLPYAAMAATWALSGVILVGQGLTWRSWAVLVGTALTTVLIVCRQLLAFGHINQLLRERDELTARLTDLAFHDGLTGLVNRTGFLRALTDSLYSGRPTTVLLIDLDRFKPVNDTFGHAAGDRLLVEVAARLRGRIGDGDTAARLGGDEFAVLATGLTGTAAATLAAQVRDALSGTVGVGTAELPLSASVGVATGTGADFDPDALLHAADMDMYRHKNAARAVPAAIPRPGRQRTST